MLVSSRFHVLFHSPPGVLFTFPSRYWFTIGHTVVFSLTRWSSLIQPEFHVLRPTRDSARSLRFSATGLSPPLVQYSAALPNLIDPLCCPTTPEYMYSGLGCSLFARRYLGNRFFFLFLQLLRCFSSLGWLYYPMYSDSSTWGCPIRTFSDLRLLPAPRDVSSVTTSFIASVCLGIHRKPFVA